MGLRGGDSMEAKLIMSKGTTVLVFYATSGRYEAAKKALEEAKAIFAKHGFPIEEIVEGKSKGVE